MANTHRKMPNLLYRLGHDGKLLLGMLRDYFRGNYRHVSWRSLALVAFILLYVISPIDLIPDVIPIIGYIDDAAMVSLALLFLENQLNAYAKWKNLSS